MFRKMYTKQYPLVINNFCMYYRCSNRILSCNWNQFVHICCQRYTTPRNRQSKYYISYLQRVFYLSKTINPYELPTQNLQCRIFVCIYAVVCFLEFSFWGFLLLLLLLCYFLRQIKTRGHNSVKAISAGQFINKQCIEYPKYIHIHTHLIKLEKQSKNIDSLKLYKTSIALYFFEQYKKII